MRVALLHWSRRKVGGAERYLGDLVAGLAGRGVEVALLHELDEPRDRGPIELPAGAPAWCVAELGAEAAIEALRDWSPDVIFTHITHDLELEERALRLAPAVYYAHGYFGTCISGTKMLARPVVTPCDRRFGAACLAHFYPNRCGGLSPLTMLRDYGRERRRLEQLARYRTIVANSEHMRAEYLRHGFRADRVVAIPPPVGALPGRDAAPGGRAAPAAAAPPVAGGERRLLFLGRMDRTKGGDVLLDALPRVRAALGAPVALTMAGDGPERAHWERRAAEMQAREPGVRVEFPGWVPEGRLASLWAGTELLVVPSLWPEPFGMVGPEAGLRGVPVAAFAVGGIPDWLADGVNGCLAPADPPSAAGLAEAVVRCLHDPARYRELRRGAARLVERFGRDRHLDALIGVLARAAGLGSAPRNPQMS
jgi:glycosyltransferase involved in cell wall biosynthesis